jgi:hypothetical protein
VSTGFRPALRYFAAVLRPRVAEALAFVGRASAIVHGGIADERAVAGLPGGEGQRSLAGGHVRGRLARKCQSSTMCR